MEFVYSIISTPVPLWLVVIILSTALMTAYFTFSLALRGFIPSLQQASEEVIKNSQQGLDAYFTTKDKQIEQLDSKLESLVTKYEKEVTIGYERLQAVYTGVGKAISYLQTSVENVHERSEAIKVLESEIIKMKHIMKRK